MEDLDELYGRVRRAEYPRDWEHDLSPVSLCEFSKETGQAMAKFLEVAKLKPFQEVARSIQMIWGVDEMGRLHVSIEEVARINGVVVKPGHPIRRGVDSRVSLDQKLGHPCILPVSGGRIAGEIYIDNATWNKELAWTLNSESGRFHGSIERWSNARQIKNVAKIFAASIGSDISLDFRDDMRSAGTEQSVSP